jgi:hypothetical protein
MNRSTLTPPLLALGLLLAGSSICPAAAVDPARVQAIAALLPARPAGFGEPITNRAPWTRLASLPAFQRLLREARTTSAEPLPESPDDLYLDFSKTGNRERWQKVAGLRRGRVPAFALAECLENQGRFLAPLEETIRALCAERTWVMPAHDTKLDNFHGRTVEMDLGATMFAWDLAAADYLLGDKLSAPTRQLLHDHLQRRIFRPFRDMAEGRRKEIFWLPAVHNWNAVCLAGVTGSALATLDAPEDRAFFVAAAEHYIKNFLRGFTPDGYCSEGLGYWNYGFGYYLLLAEAVRQATANRVDFLADPAACAPACFGLRSEIINRVYPSISDCHPGTTPDAYMMNFLCRRFALQGSPCQRDLPVAPHGALYATAMYAFLPADLPVIPLASADRTSPLRTWFSDGGVLICRAAPQTTDFAATLKGGHNAEHHNHNDVGTFMVVAGRSMLLCDPGAEVYTARTFSAHRYDSDVLNSFGHPVPVIAGQLQRTGLAARAQILQTNFTEAEDTLSLELRSAYTVPALRQLERTFTFHRLPAPSLRVLDHAEFDTPQTFETALITWGQWRQVSDRELSIVDGKDALRVTIDTAGAAFTVTAKTLEADVTTPTHPQRIALTLTAPAKSARVAIVVTPGAPVPNTK